ncbi:MAG: 30S ribosomal protein S3 [Verrucomicrobia bacterium CG_4_10_14_3_um_filter_43_23]|nr:MAG: 30S ribosomal protein S3 [Verrucomicrobia bacterium CG1_02_43_26]PIP59609.1 MAG: 30S ribosomal protein S3 [Verrucomicrobia bacterium CG22_combo_CG10-13_8_21_14_all_43_17]PIX58908.1 MAG: 30S ribosomal protein S3 [Verrucomicrobia bacterium CG_4_10_14_3_um_filter_43_23]PIY61684.1 MAG: 30S ribosomal protein S3 [Verrucomicrobia bacterium CG_4_10_14_0_8_um_filter_43_34]PJA44568.1 MAG: 30S ribosomal protein S3 [Verrucomicrobia bacterium CG_4_9_14_3_um_filter_43_20]
MGQKEHPICFRLPVEKSEGWLSKWYDDKNKRKCAQWIYEDDLIRKTLSKKLRYASVAKIVIERASGRIRITIVTARPGVVIGRRGQELEGLKSQLEKITGQEIILDIQEEKKPDIVAQIVAESIALQLERRISFRRAMKKAIQTASSLGVDGIKVQCAGRLGGAEIARTERQHWGRVPLQTIREKIDYGFSEAHTIYGLIGVKVWICKRKEA